MNPSLVGLHHSMQLRLSALAEMESLDTRFALDVAAPVIFTLAAFGHVHGETVEASTAAHGVASARSVALFVAQSGF